MRWFGRPLANLITPFFYNAGWTANDVTGLRALIATIGVLLLLFGAPLAAAAAVLIFYIGFVLDCVDGNLARLSNTATYWGKFADGLADYIFLGLAPLAVGLAAWLHADAPAVMVIAFGCVAMSLASQYVRARLSFFREWMVGQTGPIEDSVRQSWEGLRRVQALVAATYVNGTFFAPLLLLVDTSGTLYVYGLVIVQFLPEAAWLVTSLVEARAILNRSRTSKHAMAVNTASQTTCPTEIGGDSSR